jgi:hypothetical protein
MNQAQYKNDEERQKALDFKIPEEATFERMDKKFDDCDQMLKKIKLQIAEKEREERENPKKIEEVDSDLI